VTYIVLVACFCTDVSIEMTIRPIWLLNVFLLLVPVHANYGTRKFQKLFIINYKLLEIIF